MLLNHLMVNGLDDKFWFEPPSSWLEYFGVTLAQYVEVFPKEKTKSSKQFDKSEVPDNSKEESKTAEEKNEEEESQFNFGDLILLSDSVSLNTLEKEKQSLGTEEPLRPESLWIEGPLKPDPFTGILVSLGESSSSQCAADVLECAIEKPTTTSVQKPQECSDSSAAKTLLLLNTSQAQVAFLAEELKRVKMESARVAATLMKKEKVQDHEVGMRGIQREEAVKESQEKKEQMYMDQIKRMEANLKQVPTRSKDEQER